MYFLVITFSLQVVPYEKGSTFLWYLEDLVGGAEVFEPFLKSYYNNFAYKSIDSDQFKAFFLEKFSNLEAVKQIDWDTWLHTPGMPIYKVQYDSYVPSCHLEIIQQLIFKPLLQPKFDDSLARACWDLAAAWQSNHLLFLLLLLLLFFMLLFCCTL